MRPSRLALLLLGAAALAAQAQPYRWLDEKGRVHYTDTIPPANAKDVQTRKLHDNAIGQQPSFELSQAVKTAPVTLYTHPNCTDVCRTARNVLQQRGVPFTEVVANEPKTLGELKQVSGGNSVPVLVVGGQVEKTPTPDAYNEALDLAGYPAKGKLPSRGAP
jgi:glutaredoxin